MSKDESRLLVVHGDSTNHYPPRHRVAILDSLSLRTIAQLPLGDCNFLDLRPLPEHVTMLCQQSQDPGDKNKKKTFALVTLDLNRARVARWFDLGESAEEYGSARVLRLLRSDVGARCEDRRIRNVPASVGPRHLDACAHPAHIID